MRTVTGMDDALLREAAGVAGTTTKRATVDGAPAECVAAAEPRLFLEMLDEGAFDDLADAEVTADAWR